jgi:hypothetical protein
MVGFDVHNFPERSYKSALIPLMQEEKRAAINQVLIPKVLISRKLFKFKYFMDVLCFR